jgi:trigger factor
VKVTTEPLENRQLALTIEVESERVEAALAKAAKNIAGKANIPGFRKGKAPRHIVEQMFGKAALLEEAVDDLGQQVYREALEQEHIEPYGPGKLEDMQTDPLTFKMVVQLPPKVELGDYRSLREPFETPPVTDDEIEHQIEHMRERHAIVEPAPEGVAADWDHIASLNISSKVDDKDFIQEAGFEITLEKTHLDGAVPVLPGFEEQIVGMKTGEEKTFTLTVPDDGSYDESFKGKTAEFKVTLTGLKLRTLPDADDALAQTVGDFETIAALRDAIRQDIADAKKREAESAYVDRIINKLLETAKVEFPPALVEEELDEMLERTDRRLRDQKLNLDEYLKVLGKTRDEYRAELRPTAEGRIRRGLLLNEIVQAEHLDVDESEVQTEIESISASFGQRASQIRETLSSETSQRSIHLDILSRKGVNRLVAIARGEAPEQGEVESATEPTAESVAQQA